MNGSKSWWKIDTRAQLQVAGTRIDFGAWLESLPEHVAETLATGGSQCRPDVPLSASRISQLRRELFNAWP